jgi:hypothetical protein
MHIHVMHLAMHCGVGALAASGAVAPAWPSRLLNITASDRK